MILVMCIGVYDQTISAKARVCVCQVRQKKKKDLKKECSIEKKK